MAAKAKYDNAQPNERLDYTNELGPLSANMLELQQILSGNISPSNLGLFEEQDILSSKMQEAWNSVRLQESADLANMIMRCNISDLMPDPTVHTTGYRWGAGGPPNDEACHAGPLKSPVGLDTQCAPITLILPHAAGSGAHGACQDTAQAHSQQGKKTILTNKPVTSPEAPKSSTSSSLDATTGKASASESGTKRGTPVTLATQPGPAPSAQRPKLTSQANTDSMDTTPDPMLCAVNSSKVANPSDRPGTESESTPETGSSEVVTLTVQADIEALPPKDSLLDTPPPHSTATPEDANSVPSTTTTPVRSPLAEDNPPPAPTQPGPLRQKILPRTSQYEKHPLLQERSETGLSELEIFLKEKEDVVKTKQERMLKKHKSLSIEEHKLRNELDTDRHRRKSADSGGGSKMKLLPRNAQYERHPLLEKTESGLSELEQYLMEMDQEAVRRKSLKDEQAAAAAPPKNFSWSHGGSLRLQPRVMQYQKSALLQARDEDGRTTLERFLDESERQRKEAEKEAKEEDDHDVMSKDTLPLMNDEDGPLKSKSSIKRVHFEWKQGNENQDIEELGSVHLETEDKPCGDEETEPLQGPQVVTATNNRPPQQKCCAIL